MRSEHLPSGLTITAAKAQLLYNVWGTCKELASQTNKELKTAIDTGVLPGVGQRWLQRVRDALLQLESPFEWAAQDPPPAAEDEVMAEMAEVAAAEEEEEEEGDDDDEGEEDEELGSDQGTDDEDADEDDEDEEEEEDDDDAMDDAV